MAKIEFTDSWLEGSDSAREVTIPEFTEGNMFTLKPISEDDFKRWRREFRVCENCGGSKYVQVSRTRQGKCPACRGETPNLMEAETKAKILGEVCLNWRGWMTADGKEIPFTPEACRRVCDSNVAYLTILTAAQKLKVSITDADEGN